MNKEIPYSKILKLALTTTPLFGFFGATPMLVFTEMDFSKTSKGFVVISLIAFTFWVINTGLVWLAKKYFLLKNDWLRYAFSILLCSILMYCIFTIVISQISGEIPLPFPEETLKEIYRKFPNGLPIPEPTTKNFLPPLLQSQSINIMIMILLELLFLRQKKQNIEIENTELRMVNLEAKHNLLKQQLHPHFLFNSLGTLSSLIKTSPLQANDYLLKLSELLRFSTNNNSQTLVTLEEEIELCTNYLDMQQVRFREALCFYIDVPVAMQLNGKVPVYSIQLLAENALKHNVSTIKQPLHILIKGNETNGTVTVTNNLQKKLNIDNANGVGLSNLIERYRLLGEEEIIIDANGQEFNITIKVLNYESSNC